jgi:hypothetical protein
VSFCTQALYQPALPHQQGWLNAPSAIGIGISSKETNALHFKLFPIFLTFNVWNNDY